MTIRVLVVDDSAFMRKVISNILNQDKEIEVISTARNGQDAIEKVERLRPDVVTLDNEMPVLDGLDALAHIMKQCPTPVIMLSAVVGESAEVTLTALEYGAVDIIQKPSGSISLDIDEMADEMRSKVKTAAKVDLKKLGFTAEHVKEGGTGITSRRSDIKATLKPRRRLSKKLLAIGSSTGGPRALDHVITRLPADLPAAVLVVQHMPAGFTKSLAQRLNSHSALTVREAKEGDVVHEGLVLVAPGGYHMEIVQKKINGITQEVVALNQEPREQGVRPAVDVLFRSIASIYGSNILSVILTGMGRDGADGAEVIKKYGGRVIVEDEMSCVVYGMPKAIVERDLADAILPLERMSEEIVKRLN